MEKLLDKFSKQIFELFSEIHQLNRNKEETLKTNCIYSTQISELTTQLEAIKSRNNQLEHTTESLTQDIKAIKTENELLKEEIELLKKAHAGQLVQEERMLSLTAECSGLKSDLAGVQNDLNELRKTLRKKFVI